MANFSNAVYASMKGDYGPWKKWFAWYPIKVHGKYTWFKFVYRRYKYLFEPKDWQHYEYGTVFDLLRN